MTIVPYDSEGSPYQVFARYEAAMNEHSTLAANDVAAAFDSTAGRPNGERKEMLKRMLGDVMAPHVDISQDTSSAFYQEFRSAALFPATIPERGAPSRITIIDQDGNIISPRVPVGVASEAEILDFELPPVGKSVIPSISWESAVGKAFQGSEMAATLETLDQGANLILSKLIGYSDRRMHNASRELMENYAQGDDFSVGWQRLAYPGCCAFCRMLAGRGAVYKTEASATFVVGRGKVRKVRGRPHKRGRKERSYERMDRREIRQLNESFHDNCKCKVIPRWTMNGAEMPLPPLMQAIQDSYEREYYEAAKILDQRNQPRTARPVLRLMRKNNMSATTRRFMPHQPVTYMIDDLASAWPDSPYMKPRPMRFADMAKDYGTQAWDGIKVEGGIYARRKGNQFVGRVVNKQATRVQRKINRKIDQIEGLPTWQNRTLKFATSEARRKSSRAIRYNAKQGLKYVTGQKPSWNVEGLFLREWNESVRFWKGQGRRRVNRSTREGERFVRDMVNWGIRYRTAHIHEGLDDLAGKWGGWGSLIAIPVKKRVNRYERRLSRKIVRPFRRSATRLRKMIARD